MKKILILGSGALKIGEAGEFDYSGSQAIKALKEEGIKTILINPNIATIQTSEDFADQVYFLPVNCHFVEEVIRKEKPEGIIISFGGQTALNTGIELHKKGILKKYGVQILGTSIESVIIAEDRELFAKHLRKNGFSTPRSETAKSVEEAVTIAKKLDFPLMVRAGYSLGGQKSGIVFNEKELRAKVHDALAFSPQVLIEKYLHHFKEIEYEVVRDKDDNCVAVCNMENMDPLGIHTGESIVVAPSQTLTNFEYHFLRAKAIELVRSLNIIGECNVQYALNPKPKSQKSKVESEIPGSEAEHGGQFIDYYVIELNPRLSRSSALASKATGYPLAYIAAKLITGKSLIDIQNQVTKVTQSFFEPALDYIVVKIPRWDLEKFRGVEEKIGSSMKSVGEIMAIGRSFEEAVSKAMRMLDMDADGVTDIRFDTEADIVKFIKTPTPKRIFALAAAILRKIPIEDIHEWSGIDPWFLNGIKNICDLETILKSNKRKIISRDFLLKLKQAGFSDHKIALLTGKKTESIRKLRIKNKIVPRVFNIDTLAGEVPAKTNYLYTTYHGSHHDVSPLKEKGIIVLGSGPYHIGSSVEFDWSSVNVAQSLRKYKRKSIIINCNPETVSTDYDTTDRLYFEELTQERIRDIYDFENSAGVIVSVGGQTPNNLASKLEKHKCNIYGTKSRNIEIAENRNSFSNLCDSLGILQPAWIDARTTDQVLGFAEKVGYPVLIRPSYVLSGSAMHVCFNKRELVKYLNKAVVKNGKNPITASKFIPNAKEIELDGVAQKGRIKVFAIAEHIEHAGVHSGDATIVYPTQRVFSRTEKVMKNIADKLASELQITGPFNIQFLAKDNHIYVIEVNLRASRSFPFLSKATQVNFAKVATDAFFHKAKSYVIEYPDYVGVKSAQFSFARLEGADPILRVEMSSTGEVACFGSDFSQALLLSVFATGVNIRDKSALLSIGGTVNKKRFLEAAIELEKNRFTLFATAKTYTFLRENDISVTQVHKIFEDKHPNVTDVINEKKVSFVINISDKTEESVSDFDHLLTDGYHIRRAAIDQNIPLFTDLQLAMSFIRAVSKYRQSDLEVMSYREYAMEKGKSK